MIDRLKHMFEVEHAANSTLLAALTDDDTDELRIMQHVIACQLHYLGKWRGEESDVIAFSTEQQQRATAFMDTAARPLERELYRYYFAQGSTAEALQELAQYQNPDGGFGRGLEPDLRVDCSSALATSNGLVTLRNLATPAGNPLVQGAVSYLLNTYDPDARVWPVVPPEVNDAPHAPWMGHDDKLADRWYGFLANPRATIVASLQYYSSLVPANLLKQLLAAVHEHLEGHIDSIDMHELHCFADLLDVNTLRSAMRESMTRQLRSALARLVETEPAAWGSYNLRPLAVVSSPESPFADLFPEGLERNLDYLIQGQLEDGTWPITWSWGDDYPDVWPVAEAEWKGIMIVMNMRTLKAFGRLG